MNISELNTVPELLMKRAEMSPDSPALFYQRGTQWLHITWKEYWKRVTVIAKFLLNNASAGSVVAIDAPNCLEWQLFEKAALLAEMTVVGVDHHFTAEQKIALLNNVEAKILVIKDPESSVLNAVESLVAVATLNQMSLKINQERDITIVSANDFNYLEVDVCKEISVNPEATATLIFTSGSTGEPKGIPYTQAQYLLVAKAIVDDRLPSLFRVEGKTTHLCWLPLSNLFQRVADTLAILWGSTTYIISDPKNVIECTQKFEPSLLIGVPRFFEKIKEIFDQSISQKPYFLRQLVGAALNCSMIRIRYQDAKLRAPLHYRLTAQFLDFIVLRSIRKRLFGGNIKLLLTGSAPTPIPVLDFFDGIGIALYEAYGCSENIIPIAMNRPTQREKGSVGKPLPTHNVTISETGEVLVKGPGVFKGYVGKSDEGKLAKDGSLKTGDIGYIDKNGFLFLRGRKTEMIKTSTGHRVFPKKIEEMFTSEVVIEQALLLGNGRKHLAIMVTCGDNVGNIVEKHAYFKELLTKINRHLSSNEQIRSMVIIKAGFSIEKGHITANQKLRRRYIESYYSKEIDALYERISNSGSKNFIVDVV